MNKYLICGLIFALSLGRLMAGTGGKIAGRIIDSETGEGLPSVNVIIFAQWLENNENELATKIGAASDMEGYFRILNLSPGEYTVKMSMMGYAPYVVQHVKVQIDLTTPLNIQLTPQAMMGKEVVVVAQRAIVTKDISNSQMNVESKALKTLPVQNVNQVVTLQAGIQKGTEGMEVRGGSANQTAFLIDGLSMNDERSNIPYSAVSLSSIQEIQIQTGGFNAEYGNVRSGLVNVVTRDGETNRYSGTFNLRYAPPQKKHFGISLYDPNSFFNRPYMDPDVCWTGTKNGNWDAFTQKQYYSFEGWNTVAEKTLRDDDPTNDLTPEGAKRVYEWQRRRKGDIDKSDYVIDLGVGGYIPWLTPKLGNLRFFVSYFDERNMLIYPLSRDSYHNRHTQLKLTSDITGNIKLTLSGLYGEVYSVSPYNWTTTPTGRVLQDNSEIADLLSTTDGSAMLYVPAYYSPSAIYRSMIGLKLTHVLSEPTYYEVSLQYNANRYRTTQMELRDTSKVNEVLPGYFLDEAPFGYWGYGTGGIEGVMRTGGWQNLGRDHSDNSTIQSHFDLTSQINRHNQIKTGLSFALNDYDINSTTFSPSMDTWTRSMIYHVTPYRLGAYFQDKMEFEGFIANIGMRLDLSDPNSDQFVLSDYDKYYKAGYGKLLEEEVPETKVDPKWNLSPRLGVSHPISENSKLYFNYGHFQSEPSSTYRFRLQRESSGLVTYIGNPNLGLERTIAYELGYAHNLFNMFLLNLAAYYKDVTNQINWIYYQNINSSVQYYKTANNNYADIRGFEITLTKRVGKWMTGFINYTYDVQANGYFDIQRYYEDPNAQRNYLKDNPYVTKAEPRPYARANLEFHTPSKWGPQWLSDFPLAEWTMNLLVDWKTGSYTTYNPQNILFVKNNVQWRDWFNVDLRLSKIIHIRKFDVQFYLDVENLLNLKHLNYAGFADNYDYQYYMESLHFSWESGVEKGSDRIGDYRKPGVEYQPVKEAATLTEIKIPDPTAYYYIKTTDEWMQYNNNAWETIDKNMVDNVLDDKAYIDMPNISSVTFLNPRRFTFGIRFNF